MTLYGLFVKIQSPAEAPHWRFEGYAFNDVDVSRFVQAVENDIIRTKNSSSKTLTYKVVELENERP